MRSPHSTAARFVWKDPASWLPLIEQTKGIRQTQTSMLGALKLIYESILVFHGSRPVDVNDYYKKGLLLADHHQLTNRAKEIFVSREFPEINESLFQRAVEGLSGIDNGRSYVGLDDRELVEHCGHYLIYGSEHICGIAAQLSRGGKDYRQILKRFGKPTLLKLALPISLADEEDLLEFSDLVREWVPRVRAGRKPSRANFTFSLKHDLPAECVLGHEHPQDFPDPLLEWRPNYRYSGK